jgi:hypothetical protein
MQTIDACPNKVDLLSGGISSPNPEPSSIWQFAQFAAKSLLP